jgi:hypothetical protein
MLSKEQGITVVALCLIYDFFIVQKVNLYHKTIIMLVSSYINGTVILHLDPSIILVVCELTIAHKRHVYCT